ncbi:hypothetical protein Bca4012_038577 [Brassica carinata]|uniref:GTD-binding domain-containing protein n=1 Tax=Brassica carinata TaxID=52824 RepID=A0A8X7W6F8_BRACI|nr:hypothetical protein Bca52824_006894 [Brassica carinata]
MPCLDTQDWSLTGLIGGFLNLSIAYLLLCTSLFIHVVLRSLGFLGFSLPRFQNGRFGVPNMCIEGDLVACASERISSVDRLIKSKIPFGSNTSDNDDDTKRFVEMKLVRKNSGDVSNARVKDETEEDHVSRDEQNVEGLGGFNLMTVQGVKGKRFVTRRSRKGPKNPRRCRVDYESVGSVSSSEAFDETVKHPLMQPYDHVFIRRSNDESKDDDEKTKERIGLSHWPVLEKTVSLDEQVNSTNSSANLCFVRNVEEKTVKELEEALKQERAARAAVCVELDKERNAAASAADEAMAMIHRLQDEKAAIEMEAMQFQRMVEEKSTFDAEEMVILKDILIRREREKHFLEKEVEAYRDLLIETEESESSLPKEKSTENMVKSGREQNQEPPQERRALIVQEHDGTVLDMPYREDKNRYLYTSDSEVPYSRVRDVYTVKEETEKVGKKKSLEESSGIAVSGIARKLPPLCRPRKQSLSSSGSRRKSMSAVDYERLKIENEVELLRERLKAVQEERKELTRRASLPPLSSKVRVTSKNRGWRRSSVDLHSS